MDVWNAKRYTLLSRRVGWCVTCIVELLSCNLPDNASLAATAIASSYYIIIMKSYQEKSLNSTLYYIRDRLKMAEMYVHTVKRPDRIYLLTFLDCVLERSPFKESLSLGAVLVHLSSMQTVLRRAQHGAEVHKHQPH